MSMNAAGNITETAFGAYPGIRDRVAAAGFSAALSAVSETDAMQEDAYIQHLQSKYGAHFQIRSIPNDPKMLEHLGKGMHGDDVIIAPNIVTEMARDPEVAAWYESVIDHCFATVPEDKAHFAAMGLTFEPCGVVVHEDGTVTYICGGGDSPERVAQVNAINAARDAKRAAQRRAYQEAHIKSTQELRLGFERRAEAAAQAARLQTVLSRHSMTLSAQGNAYGMVSQTPTALLPESAR